MPDFLGPAQLMGQQLQGVLQDAANSAANARAASENRHMQMQEIAKNFEIKATLAERIMATDPVAALDFMNDGLKGFGAKLTMEQFRPALEGFKVMADLTRDGDHQGAQGVLKSMKERGWLGNLRDQQRAAELEREAGQHLAEQQAKTIQDLQEEPPGLARARELMALPQQQELGSGNEWQADELVRLTGQTDPVEQENARIRAQAIVEGHDTQRQHYANLFQASPAAFGQAAHMAGQSLADPQKVADGRISALLQNPNRTEAEEREKNAKILVYGNPALQAAEGLRTAERDAEQVRHQLEDTQSRLSAMKTHRDAYDLAQVGALSITDTVKGLPNAAGPLTDDAAKQHLLAEGTRQVEGQAFLAKQQGQIQSLQQTADAADKRRLDLTRQMLGAMPAQKEEIARQITEFEAMAKNNNALARLLKDENHYQIEQKRADLALMDKGSSRVYPQREPTESEKEFFKKNPNVAGYAASDKTVVLNPYSTNTAKEQSHVLQNERTRHAINDSGVRFDFDITPAQRKLVDSFGNAPNDYGRNDTLLRQTIIARMNSGDQSLAPYTDQQKTALQQFNDQLDGKAAAQASLTTLERQRDNDLAVVDAEKARLERREKILMMKRPKADRDAEEEQREKMAVRWVTGEIGKGKSLLPAVNEAAAAFDITDKAKLVKTIKETQGLGIAEAQIYTLSKYGRTVTAPQLAETSKRFGVKPEEILAGLVDPSQRGRFQLDVNMPTNKVRSDMQSAMLSTESSLNIINNIKTVLKQENIGLAAALKSTAYGLGAQVQGLAKTVMAEATITKQKGFTPSKWFDPNVSTIDLLANTLAYRLVNQEQGGRITDKDIAEMRSRLNVTSWLAGKEDILARFTAIEGQLKFERSLYQRIIPNFGKTPSTGNVMDDLLHDYGGNEAP